MSSFVITNTGSIPIKIAGVDLAGNNTCRGCPIEHIDKIEAPKDATYFINYVGKPDIVIEKDGETIYQKQVCEDISYNGKTLKAGERTEVIEVKNAEAVKE